jgi:hypothetical protein
MWLILISLILAVYNTPATAEPRTFPQRWNYIRPNIDTEEGLQNFLDLLKQSRDVGCTHILINEGRYLRNANDSTYLATVDKIRATAKELNLTLVPTVYPFGYSGRYLGFNRNLAAGLPVKNMPFIVKGQTAQPHPQLALDLSALDSTGSGPVQVRPFTHYRITFSIKEKPQRPNNFISADSPHRRHVRAYPRFTEVNGQVHVTTTFNSLEADSLTLRIRSESPITDLTIEPLGPLMILRRKLTPLQITSADGKTAYEEGKDFEPVQDPVIAQTEGEMTMDHEAVPIILTPKSRIQNGQTLLVSFFHAYRVLDEQDIITLEDPAVFDLMKRDIELCTQVWQPTDYFMNYDEIRIGGWERPDMPPGKTLAAHMQKGIEIIKQQAPNARIYTWSDMVTPHHNARPFSERNEYYYLTNGTWEGSWEGLPKDVIVLNWFARDKKAIAFFADRGNAQVLCGYYDPRDEDRLKQNISRWLTLSENQPNILGIMYTTWNRNYTDMEKFFTLIETFDSWRGTVKPDEQ